MIAGERLTVFITAVTSTSGGASALITQETLELIQQVNITCALCATPLVNPVCSISSNSCNATLSILQSAGAESTVPILASYTTGATSISTSLSVPPVLIRAANLSTFSAVVALERVVIASCAACVMANTVSRSITSIPYFDGAATGEAANEVEVAFFRSGQATVRLTTLDASLTRILSRTISIAPHAIVCSYRTESSSSPSILTADETVTVMCSGHTALTMPLQVICDNSSSMAACGIAIAPASSASPVSSWTIPASKLGARNTLSFSVATATAPSAVTVFFASMALFDLSAHPGALRMLVPGTSSLNTSSLITAVTAKASCPTCRVLSKITPFVNGTVEITILVVDSVSRAPVTLASADQTEIRCGFNDQSAAAAGCPGRSTESTTTKTMYIAVGAGCGGFLLLVIIVGAVIRNKKARKGTGQKPGGQSSENGGGVLNMMDDDAIHQLPADHLFQEDDDDFAVDDMAPGDDLQRAYRANNRRLSIRPEFGDPIPPMNLPVRRGVLVHPDDRDPADAAQPARLLVHPSELEDHPSPLRGLSAQASFRRTQQQQPRMTYSQAEALNLI